MNDLKFPLEIIKIERKLYKVKYFLEIKNSIK
jgi:hypothetical protein